MIATQKSRPKKAERSKPIDEKPSKTIQEQVKAVVAAWDKTAATNKAYNLTEKELQRVYEELPVRAEWQQLEKALEAAEEKLSEARAQTDSVDKVIAALKQGKSPDAIVNRHQRATVEEALYTEVID